MVTRMGLVVKNKLFSTKSGDENRARRQKKRFSTKSGDENEARRQKKAFLNQKWRRKRGSSPKTSFSQPKVVTKTRLVAKNGHISPKNGDENEFRRQKQAFLTQKW
ncbi:hypothetical protein QPM05_10795 [Caldibacillus thermoamylovorans]|nr:hypothetical protein [Caldibacillus thermoamylovorans]